MASNQISENPFDLTDDIPDSLKEHIAATKQRISIHPALSPFRDMCLEMCDDCRRAIQHRYLTHISDNHKAILDLLSIQLVHIDIQNSQHRNNSRALCCEGDVFSLCGTIKKLQHTKRWDFSESSPVCTYSELTVDDIFEMTMDICADLEVDRLTFRLCYYGNGCFYKFVDMKVHLIHSIKDLLRGMHRDKLSKLQ